MFCPQCGREFNDRPNFCCQCGAALSAPPVSRRRLCRSRTNRKLAGVCAGFAEYLNLDPNLVRILWVMLVVFWGCGVIGYIIGWILMPEEPLPQPSPAPAPQTSPQASSP